MTHQVWGKSKYINIISLPTIIEYLLYARNCCESLISNNSHNLLNGLLRDYYSHFTDDETEAQRGPENAQVHVASTWHSGVRARAWLPGDLHAHDRGITSGAGLRHHGGEQPR